MNDDHISDLSDYRLNKARELADEARLLFDNRRYDGCVNRSYYAIFSAIRSLLALVGLDSRKHSGVISYFDRYFVRDGTFDREFSRIVHNSFDVRQASDYQDFYVISEAQARAQLEGCMKFISEVEEKQALFLREEIGLPNVE
ncbi:HEPN domain-containing protein [Desulfobacterales bacterium HSG2]|nr:HEPN domain-containing protein [Desulfobacterales bacterium HSG2]